MPQLQNFKNHMRFDPAYHFVLLPVLLLNIIFSIYATVHAWPLFMHRDLWWIVMAVTLLLVALLFRSYAAKNQDRIIRLEEQLRLADLLPESRLDVVEALTMKQFIAIRFASDAEAAAIAIRAANENLTQKQIKEAIVNWRADHHRI